MVPGGNALALEGIDWTFKTLQNNQRIVLGFPLNGMLRISTKSGDNGVCLQPHTFHSQGIDYQGHDAEAGENGGSATFRSGNGTSTTVGGTLTVQPGSSNSASAAPAMTIEGGINSGAGNGGQVTLKSGSTAGAGNGGDLIIQGGRSTGGGTGGNIYMRTGNSPSTGLPVLSLDPAGNVEIGYAAIATDATDGFLYLPTCAGTPTGTPTAKTGRVALVYDSANDLLYAYNGGWVSAAFT